MTVHNGRQQASGSFLFNNLTKNTVWSLVVGVGLGYLALPWLPSLGTDSALAAEMPLNSQVTGIWYDSSEEPAPFNWKAQWVWLSDDIDSDMMLARRTFDLEARPVRALLRISASSLYQLFVNGQYIGRGPARCAPHHQSFDMFEIGKLLREGRNSLAVRVHFQSGTISYHHSGRSGLLAQLDIPSADNANPVITDANWRVRADPSWSADSPLISRFHLETCDRVDMRTFIQGWNTLEYDDSDWSAATPLLRNVGWPSPQPNSTPQSLTPPWTSLHLRDVPYLRESEVRATRLIEAVPLDTLSDKPGKPAPATEALPTFDRITLSGKVADAVATGLEGYAKGASPLTMPAAPSNDCFLVFDFGTVMNGMPMLTVDGSSGTVIDVMCTPYILDGQFSAKIFDSELIDRVVLSGERDRWEACYFKPTRYLGLVVRNADTPIRIHAVGVRRVQYPFQMRGSLKTREDPWYEECWRAAAKTIQVCTTDAYTDNYRERRQYAQTGYYAALGNYWVFGDTALQRRYLRQIAEEQEANGMMPAYAPRTADDYMVILDSNCLWVRSLRDYLLYSGDERFVRSMLPAARRLMDLLHGFANPQQLLDSPPFAYWLDHAIIDRRGANFCLNGHYLGAVEDFAQVLRWLKEPGAEEFENRANAIRAALREHFWVPRRKLFADALVDGTLSSMFSEQSNALALLQGVASRQQAAEIAQQLLVSDQHDYVQRESGVTMVTPAVSYALHAGLARYGYVEQSLSKFRQRFDRMLTPTSNGTLWEEWWLDGTGRSGKFRKGKTRSDAQTESAFPPALFGEFLLGVRPTEPGLKKVQLSRPRSGLSRLEGTVPSPLGPLHVRWASSDSGGGQLHLTIPEAMQVQVDTSTLDMKRGSSLIVDDREIRSTEIPPHLRLSNGSHTIQF